MTAIRRIGIAFLVTVIAAVAVYSAFPEPAHAVTERPSRALVSARSAALPSSGGMVQLGRAGQPSRDFERAATRAQIPASDWGGNLGDFFQSSMSFTREMCRAVIDAGTGGIAGAVSGFVDTLTGVDIVGFLSTVCGGLISAVLTALKAAADMFLTMTNRFIAPIRAWVMKQALGFALGYDWEKCGDLTKAKLSSACNGKSAKQKLFSITDTKTAGVMLTLSLAMALPILLIAVMSALMKQSLGELGKMMLKIPFVWIAASAAIVILGVAVGLRDGLVTFIVNRTDMASNILDMFNTGSGSQLLEITTAEESIGQFLGLIASMIGSILLYVVFLVGDVIIFSSVLFVPLATVGLIWGGSAKWFKKLAELSFAFVIGKVVVVAIIALAIEMLAVGT